MNTLKVSRWVRDQLRVICALAGFLTFLLNGLFPPWEAVTSTSITHSVGGTQRSVFDNTSSSTDRRDWNYHSDTTFHAYFFLFNSSPSIPTIWPDHRDADGHWGHQGGTSNFHIDFARFAVQTITIILCFGCIFWALPTRNPGETGIRSAP